MVIKSFSSRPRHASEICSIRPWATIPHQPFKSRTSDITFSRFVWLIHKYFLRFHYIRSLHLLPQLVMQYLYSGGCHSLNVIAPNDVLELMAAASFFQLDGLLRHTEARCSQIIDIDNVVPTYIHANVSNQFTFLLRTLKRNVAISLFVILIGLRCFEASGILWRISAQKYGRLAHVQRVRETNIIRQENSKSRRTQWVAFDSSSPNSIQSMKTTLKIRMPVDTAID